MGQVALESFGLHSELIIMKCVLMKHSLRLGSSLYM